MRKLLPILLMVLALAGGVGAGLALRPPPVAAAVAPDAPPAPANTEVLRLPNPFLVPLIGEGRVRAMVVVGLALELRPGHGIDLAAQEPRLRAIFLQLLFDHANLGGFDGVFTGGEPLIALRRRLLDAVRAAYGSAVHDVLIIDLVRQEG